MCTAPVLESGLVDYFVLAVLLDMVAIGNTGGNLHLYVASLVSEHKQEDVGPGARSHGGKGNGKAGVDVVVEDSRRVRYLSKLVRFRYVWF